MPDAHKNFAVSLVATAPSPATSGTSLVVTAADGAKFPTAPFNATIWPAGAAPTTANSEIVRVTAVSTDTLTITRAQESSSARTVIVGDQIAATITAKTLTDIEAAVAAQTYGVDGTSGCLASSYDRSVVVGSLVAGAATSGTLRIYLLPLPAGLVVTSLTFWAGSTAGATLTHSWAALFDVNRNKLAVSADNTGATWAINTSRTFTLTAPYTVPTTQACYVGLVIAGTTIPTIEAVSGLSTTGVRASAPISGGNADAGLTTPASCPATAAAISILGQVAYCEIH
jgi:hypothetical protein